MTKTITLHMNIDTYWVETQLPKKPMDNDELNEMWERYIKPDLANLISEIDKG